MGLDAVEIIMRSEEFFAVEYTDEEVSHIRTVRDFYELTCRKLHLDPGIHLTPIDHPPVISQRERTFLVLERRTPLPAPPEFLPWTPHTVWLALVAIFVDRQGLRPYEVLPDARLAEDLGID